MSNATIIGSASEFNGVTTFKSQPIITSTILANTDSSTNIATTAWSNAFWTYVKTQANTFSGTTTFSNTTNINTTGSATTTIGNILSTTNISGSVINISGAVNINTIGTTTTTIGNILSTTNISGSAINISGDLNINTGGTATTTIGNTAGATNVLGQVNIANDGLPTSGGVNIATNGFGSGSYITIGSATFPQIYMRSVNTKINDDGGSTYIGKDNVGRVELRGAIVVLNGQGGDLNLGGVSSGTINLYRPLSPQYSYPIASGKIGEIINGTYAPAAGAFFTYSNPIVYSSITLSQVGVYIFQGNLLIITNNSSMTNITWISVDISTSGGAILSTEQRLNQVPPANGYGFVMCANAIVYNTGVTTYNISINTNFTGGNPYPNGGFFIYKAVRIA